MASYGVYLGRLADGSLLLVCLYCIVLLERGEHDHEPGTISGDGHVSKLLLVGLGKRFGSLPKIFLSR